jgi:hypothetical protein
MGNSLGVDQSRAPTARTESNHAPTLENLDSPAANSFTQIRDLKAAFPVGTQLVIAGGDYARVVLDYYRDSYRFEQVLLGAPGEPPVVGAVSVTSLAYATPVNTLDQDACNALLNTQAAKNLAIAATHRLRCERRDDPGQTPIPYLSDRPDLRLELLREIAPIVAQLLAQGPVADSTVLGLVKEFFDRRLPPPQEPEQERESKFGRHLKFAEAPTESGRIEFEDPAVPVTVEGLDGYPVQVVTSEFVAAELDKSRPASDPVAVTRGQVKKWLQEHLEPYPMRVTWHGEQSSAASQAYLLSDILIALRDHPLRTEAPRLDASGRGHVDVAGVPTEVVTASALSLHRAVPTSLVTQVLSKLGVEPLQGVQMREHDSERLCRVYPAEAADPIVSLLLTQYGVAIPSSMHSAPFRIALTTAAYAQKLGESNLYQLERALEGEGKKPIAIGDLGITLKPKGSPFGSRHSLVYEASVPESNQTRLLMTDLKGILHAFTHTGIKTVERLYWLDELEDLRAPSLAAATAR